MAHPSSNTDRTPRDRSVTLIRGVHRWRVSCAAGQEQSLVDSLLEHALSENSPLGLEDVALIRTRLVSAPRIGVNQASPTPDRP